MAPEFADLLAPVEVPEALARWRPSGLDNDSRRMAPDGLFLAYKGGQTDGKNYLQEAAARGAKAALVDVLDVSAWHHIGMPLVFYPELSSQLGRLSGRYYHWPDRTLPLAAVTGTAGKTTTAWLTAQLLQRLNTACGYIGTLGAGQVGGEMLPLDNTTPDLLSMRRVLYQLKEQQQIQAAVLEASSEGLAQHRVSDLEIRVAVLTNLGQDHVQAHGGIKGLKAAKRALFELPSVQSAVINSDDAFGREIVTYLRAQRPDVALITYGTRADAQLRLSFAQDGCQLHLQDGLETGASELWRLPPLMGRHNQYNLCAALAILMALGYPEAAIESMLSVKAPLRLPAGRLQHVFAQPDCYVDYAHSPEALEAALDAVRALTASRVICVFGCGGGRDRDKRALMGQVASAKADLVILTSDNPRHEDNQAIVADIVAGIASSVEYQVDADRAGAIASALSQAGPQDSVLIAGKGHENYQIVGDQRVPLCDVTVAHAWRQNNARRF